MERKTILVGSLIFGTLCCFIALIIAYILSDNLVDEEQTKGDNANKKHQELKSNLWNSIVLYMVGTWLALVFTSLTL